MNKNILVLILAAGDSSRLWPLEEKHFLSILHKPLIYHSVEQLRRFGFRQMVIVVSPRNKYLFERLQSEFSDLNIRLVEQTDPRGMAGAVISAASLIAGRQLLIVGPSDIFEDILLADFTKMVVQNPQAILAGTKMDNYFPGAYLKIVDKIVTDIVEKPDEKKIPSHIVNFVFDYFSESNQLLAAFAKVKTTKDDLYEKAIGKMVKEGIVFKLLEYQGFWGYLKYPWHILNVASYFLAKLKSQKAKDVMVHKTAVIEGNVVLGKGVKVLEYAKIAGPAFIGEGSIIGNNVLVRESMIGKNCVVGFGSEVARSYIGDNCWFHNNYIGDSVIGNHVSMGKGAVTANYRLDEGVVHSLVNGQKIKTNRVKLGSIIGPNVHIGINVSIMPGVKIGKNSLVGAALCLTQDIPDNSYCTVEKIAYTIRSNKIIKGKTKK